MPISSTPEDKRKRRSAKDEGPIGRRLIESGLLDIESSSGGLAERYRRGETPQTIHVWWARRPHTAMRSLIFSAIAPESDNSHQILKRIAYCSVLPPLVLADIRNAIAEDWPTPPRVLDMFGGGGTIPFEASTLGAETFSIDSNELSVFLQTSLLNDAIRVPNLASLVSESGKAVLSRLATASAPLFPDRKSAFAYIWTYSCQCSACGYEFLLSKRPWLSRKGKKRIAIVKNPSASGESISVANVSDDYKFNTNWVGRSGTVTCPHCQSTEKSLSIGRLTDKVAATVGHGEKAGKQFGPPTDKAVPPSDIVHSITAKCLGFLNAELPSSRLPRWSGIVNPSLYGIETHADFVNPRQRAVLLLLLCELRAEYEQLAMSHPESVAIAILSILSGLVDQLVDWNCRLSMWISQNEQVGRAFSGPGVPMLWDYAELDPACEGPANLWSKLQRLVAGCKSLASAKSPVTVRKAYAQQLPFDDESFDAIVTDPPYYDNIYYNVLADFFYAWKRLLFRGLTTTLFNEVVTDSSRELVASKFRSGSNAEAHQDYCREFGYAIREASRVLRKNGLFCLVYSHSSIQGWEAVLQAYRSAALEVSSVQPLCIERKARPRAMTSEAINTCVVFVAKKRSGAKGDLHPELLDAHIRSNASIVSTLRDAGWSEADIGLSLFAKGIGFASNYERGKSFETDKDLALEIQRLVQIPIPDFRIANRKSL